MTLADLPDDALVQRLERGDVEAGAAFLSRHLATLYDFALRAALDLSVAESALLALGRRIAGDGVSRPHGMAARLWLFAILREELLEAARGREDSDGKVSPIDPAFSQVPAGLPFSDDPQLAAWAWQAARAQRPRDYSILDLVVRRGVAEAEVGLVAAMASREASNLVSRLLTAFEEHYAASCLYNRGREACKALDALASMSDVLRPSLRRDIARHAEACSNCKRTLSRFSPPADLFASFLLLRPPERVASAVMASLRSAREGLAQTSHEDAPQQAVFPIAAATPGFDDTFASSEGLGAGEDFESAPLGIRSGEWEVSVEEVTRPVDVEAASGEEDLPAHGVPPYLRRLVNEEDERGSEDGGEGTPQEEDEPMYEAEPVDQAPLAAAAPYASGGLLVPRGADRVPPGSDGSFGGMGPPRRPWDRLLAHFRENERWRPLFFVAFAGIVIIAVYLGIALGASIQRGSGGGPGAVVPPTGTAGVPEIGCGEGPISLDQGVSTALAFDESALPGYRITSSEVIPVSNLAEAARVSRRIDGPMRLSVEVAPVSVAAARTDEYRLRVIFERNGRQTIAECRLLVRIPAAQPTPTASPTQQPTATSTPRPAQPTSPPATPTPTPTAPTPTATPTAVATATATSAATATPTATPTPTVGP